MSPAGGVSIHNSLFAADIGACWEVRARQALDNVLESAVWVINDQQQGITDLRDIVRRDVSGHTHRNSGGAVDQQVREL